MSNPEFVKVNNKLYKINTDFRIALECNDIIADESIGDYETVLAVIYKLFGKDGLECKNQSRLLELAIKYLTLGREQNGFKMDSGNDYELDFKKCKGLIKSSFKYDYGYDPYESKHIHWYTFYNDLENLSTSEFGNCCALNRIASIINQDASQIKEDKDRNNLVKLQHELRLKYCVDKDIKVELTKEQKESAKAFYESLGYKVED